MKLGILLLRRYHLRTHDLIQVVIVDQCFNNGLEHDQAINASKLIHFPYIEA